MFFRNCDKCRVGPIVGRYIYHCDTCEQDFCTHCYTLMTKNMEPLCHPETVVKVTDRFCSSYRPVTGRKLMTLMAINEHGK